MKENHTQTMTRSINMFYVHVSDESIQRVVEVLKSGYIGQGPLVRDLEEDYFPKVSGAPWNIAMNSGTSALHSAVVLAGVNRGDEVITTAQTMMATGHSILMQGGVPVFADVCYETGNIDPKDIEHRITEKTKAILCVHWAGYPCDMDEIHEIAKKHKLIVIEDAAHAIGAQYKGKPIGSISPMTCFSFQATKHITGGDGGMLSLFDEKNKIEASRLRWFGIDRDERRPSILGEQEWNVTKLGYKYQMNDIAAAITLGNLKCLDKMISRRQSIALRYRNNFSDIPGITLLENKNDRTSAHWMYTLHVERRENFMKMLQAKSIHASVVHLRIDRNDLYGGECTDLPNLEKFTATHTSLPIHEGLNDDDVDYIINAVKGGW